MITAAPTVNATNVALTFVPAVVDPVTGNAYTSDPLGISTDSSTNLGQGFCTGDWVMKLEPTTYTVDVSNPQDPKLIRQQNGASDTIAEQVIGFKVGAATWNIALDYQHSHLQLLRAERVGCHSPGLRRQFSACTLGARDSDRQNKPQSRSHLHVSEYL